MTQTNADGQNGSTADEVMRRLVRHVIRHVEPGDILTFNDRDEQFVVNGTFSGDNLTHATVKSSENDNVFRFMVSDTNGPQFLRPTGERTKYVTREWESYPLETVDILHTHRFETGDVYEYGIDRDDMSQSRLLAIVTGETTRHDDPVVIRLHIRKGDVLSAERDYLSKAYHKPKIVTDESSMEQVGRLASKYHDHSVDDDFSITAFGSDEDTVGVKVTYNTGSSTYLPYTLFIPETEIRFEPLN